jgi:hypothetical protein
MPNDRMTHESCQWDNRLMLPRGQRDGSTAQQGEEGFGRLDGLIGNCCHLEGTFDGGCGDGGGGNAI